jgi:hypothetical protein
MARYANWHSDQVESLMSVGSTPTRATEVMGCWSNGTTPGLQPGNRGSIPRRSTGSEEDELRFAGVDVSATANFDTGVA